MIGTYSIKELERLAHELAHTHWWQFRRRRQLRMARRAIKGKLYEKLYGGQP